MIVYHGSSVVVEKPDVKHSFRPLDFGRGFYVTTVKEQAEKWAKRKVELFDTTMAIVNQYQMKNDMAGILIKTFHDDLEEWIDFVCDCRDGSLCYEQYDLIYGKVANDKVFRVVDMYHQGIWDKTRTLEEIKAYDNYDQYAFITPKAIDTLLTFDSYYEVT